MKRSVLKLLLFFGILSIPLFLLSVTTKRLRAKAAAEYFRVPAPVTNDTGWYFIGSSRVQMSVDTSILISKLQKQSIFNLGVSGATFLTSNFIALELMKSSQPKVLFIELTAMLTEMPVDLFEQRPSLESDMYRTARLFYSSRNLRDQAQLAVEFGNRYLSARVFYYDQLQNAMLAADSTRHPGFGFVAWPAGGFSSDVSILRWAELASYTNHQAVSEYAGYFEKLYAAAKGTNTRIIFFMPLTFGSEMERQVIIPVYNSIASKDKIVITPALATAVHNKLYLMNANHFNRDGAAIYSAWLADELRRMREAGHLGPFTN